MPRSSPATKELAERIVATPGICGGRPRIAGTRIPVASVLEDHAAGVTLEELLEHYPSLTAEDVTAALAYGAENSPAPEA